MKKLFLTLFMFGVTLAGWSQLTKTNWDASTGTLTLNYAGGGLPSTDDAIKDVLGRGPQGAEHKVQTLILTGVISNSEINTEAFEKLINTCLPPKQGGPQSPDPTLALDLSDCTYLCSKFVSVSDNYPGGEQVASATFTSLPGNGQPLVGTVHHDYTLEKTQSTVTTVSWNNGSSSFDIQGEIVKGQSYKIDNFNGAEGYLEWVPNQNKWAVRVPSWGNSYQDCNVVTNHLTIYTDTATGNVVENVDESKLVATETENVFTYSYDEQVTLATEPMSLSKTRKKINSISFPTHSNFDFIPNELLMEATGLISATIPDNIIAIGNSAFQKATNLQTVNFPENLQEIGVYAFEKTSLLHVNLYNTKVKRIRAICFEDCYSLIDFVGPKDLERIDVKAFMETYALETVTLSSCKLIEFGAFKDAHNLATFTFPTNLEQIKQRAFDCTAIVDVDLHLCHGLTLIEKDAFQNDQALTTVTVCSHPKVIEGGQGAGAFYNCKHIRRVEITACDEITDITQCVCQCGAFDQDVTYCGTNASFETVETQAALLVFPETAPVPQSSSYTSSFDFFVGDYKTGTKITQTALQGLHKDVPNDGKGRYKYNIYDEDGNLIESDHWEEKTVMYQKNDGWHEFIKTDFGQIIHDEDGNFLRTYSRSVGTGPCILPNTIAAYRAVDYMTDDHDWVEDKSGKYYCADETADPKQYILIPTVDGAFDSATLQLIKDNGYKRYSFLTIGGKVYLKRLTPYVANLKDDQGKDIPYNDDVYYQDKNKPAAEQRTNKDFYDDIVFNNNNLTAVPNGVSYVPENTGVVLYSKRVNEDYLLVLGGYFGTATVLPEYPHTGHRYEADRLTSDDTRNNINMLQGTFDVKTLVSPVFPWFGQNETTGAGGRYNDSRGPREYRNFAFNKAKMKWLRLKPCIAADNFAFASIPVERFDNFNESATQMPDFVEEDLSGGDANSSNCMLINIFEDEDNSSADGIKVVNTVIVNADSNAWYTIQGVKVAQPTKGVYIHNGKKVVIK